MNEEKIEKILAEIDKIESGNMDLHDTETVASLKKIVRELNLESAAAEAAYESRLRRLIALEKMERERQEERRRMNLRWCVLVYICRMSPLEAFALCTPAAPAPTF